MLRVVVIAGAERLCTGRLNGIALARWLRGPRDWPRTTKIRNDSDSEARIECRPCESPPVGVGSRCPGCSRGHGRLQRILNHNRYGNRSRVGEVSGVTGKLVGSRCGRWRSQVINRDTTGVRVDGIECRELDLRIVACFRTRQRRRGVSSYAQRRIIRARGRHRRQREPRARVTTRAMPLQRRASESERQRGRRRRRRHRRDAERMRVDGNNRCRLDQPVFPTVGQREWLCEFHGFVKWRR